MNLPKDFEKLNHLFVLVEPNILQVLAFQIDIRNLANASNSLTVL